MNVSGAQKVNIPRIAIVLGISIVAILVISFTVGKDIYEGRNQTLTSFSAIHFSGYLFFLLMPVEMVFIYYLTLYDAFTLVWFALITAIGAQFVDYLIGYSIGKQAISKLVGEKKIQWAKKYIHQYGNLTIFFFNFLPLSSPVISLVAGILRYSKRDLFIFSFIGLLLKYVVLCLITDWFL